MAKKLGYDSTDADTLAASDFVGSHLYASGTKLTRTTVGAAEALDVYIQNALTVEIDGVYDAGDNTDPDNMGLIAHSRAASPGDAEQVERVTSGAASSDNVVAANVHGLDVNSFGMLFDGTTWDRWQGTGGAAHIHDGGGSISIDDNGGSITVDGSVTVSDAALANVAYLATRNAAIDDTESSVLASQLANRKYWLGFNNSKKNIEIINTGDNYGDGFPIYPGVYQMLRAGPALDFKVIGPTGSAALDFAVLELS